MLIYEPGVEVWQIGAGGTGNWFARTLMHNLLEKFNDNTVGIGEMTTRALDWRIYDPDKVEARNLIRQPFYGGIDQYKAEYLARVLSNTFSSFSISDNRYDVEGPVKGYIRTIHENDLFVDGISKIRGFFLDHPRKCLIIVCCVDNTYTRTQLEQAIKTVTNPETPVLYLNMGVAPNGDWVAEAVGAQRVMFTPYDEVTYPDSTLSCAEREEMTPIPQTVFSNVMAGSCAAQMLTEILFEPNEEILSRKTLSSYMKIVYGNKDPEVKVMPPDFYVYERMKTTKGDANEACKVDGESGGDDEVLCRSSAGDRHPVSDSPDT